MAPSLPCNIQTPEIGWTVVSLCGIYFTAECIGIIFIYSDIIFVYFCEFLSQLPIIVKIERQQAVV